LQGQQYSKVAIRRWRLAPTSDADLGEPALRPGFVDVVVRRENGGRLLTVIA
jgi:hypothetical protein